MAEYRNIVCVVCDVYHMSAKKIHPPSPASGMFRVDGGCVVVKNLYQPLCEQHICSCEPIGPGGMEMIEDYRVGTSKESTKELPTNCQEIP